MVKKGYSNPNKSGYLEELASCIDVCGDSDEMLLILAEIEDWCKYRNKIIHSNFAVKYCECILKIQ